MIPFKGFHLKKNNYFRYQGIGWARACLASNVNDVILLL